MTKKQITNLLGAGTISALAVILALLIGGQGAESGATSAEAEQPAPVQVVETTEDVDALVLQNEQLQEAVTVLQERETQYQEQLTLAQDTLNEQAMADAEMVEGEPEPEEMEEEEEDDEDEDESEEDDD